MYFGSISIDSRWVTLLIMSNTDLLGVFCIQSSIGWLWFCSIWTPVQYSTIEYTFENINKEQRVSHVAIYMNCQNHSELLIPSSHLTQQESPDGPSVYWDTGVLKQPLQLSYSNTGNLCWVNIWTRVAYHTQPHFQIQTKKLMRLVSWNVWLLNHHLLYNPNLSTSKEIHLGPYSQAS